MGNLNVTSKTAAAFDAFRSIYPAKQPNSDRIRNVGELRQMSIEDGLKIWIDGDASADLPEQEPPSLSVKDERRCSLWVIRIDDVVHAPKFCQFASQLESKETKHTNLTGGLPAHSGGEICFIASGSIVLNGCSGRYGPRSVAELEAAAKAFRQSGYSVWMMGYEQDTNRPLPFVGTSPRWVE